MEYVVVNNSDYEFFDDFHKWRGDPKNPELRLLWRFKFPKRLCVTSMLFNKKHPQLFVVGMGSYDFNNPTEGIISLYSLKNPTTPEISFDTQSAVMCMDFCEKNPTLLCVGFYNGGVAVYDIRRIINQTVYHVTDPEVQHSDPVWGVKWVCTSCSNEFLSVSSDGTLVKWTMAKNELTKTVLMELKRSENTNDCEGLLRTVQACAFDLNPFIHTKFLVGTEFGEIYCYDLENNNQPVQYEGHNMQVYAVRWNPFHENTFLSASEDWTVKLWDSKQLTPIIVYDLISPVGDISWSPFSSTAFVAVTYDNKIHFFDLIVNKNDACVRYSKDSKGQKYAMTHVSFCAIESSSMIITGNKFGLISLHLLPQLRQNMKVGTDEQEKTKLEKLLKITGTNVLDLNKINVSTYATEV